MKNLESPETNQNEVPVIVEIGPNHLPVYRIFNEESIQAIGKDASYIAIDINQEELEKARIGDRGQGVIGDIRELPLADDSADQIWMMNVFGGFENRPHHKDGKSVYNLGLNDVFKEMARVIKTKGKIYIGETYAPMRGNLEWMADEDYSEFGLEKEAYKGAEAVRNFLEKKGLNELLLSNLKDTEEFKPFFMILQKAKVKK